MRERTQLEQSIEEVTAIEQELEDSMTLIELGEAEGDDSVLGEADATLESLRARAAKRELETLLSGEADSNDCFLEVQLLLTNCLMNNNLQLDLQHHIKYHYN